MCVYGLLCTYTRVMFTSVSNMVLGQLRFLTPFLAVFSLAYLCPAISLEVGCYTPGECKHSQLVDIVSEVAEPQQCSRRCRENGECGFFTFHTVRGNPNFRLKSHT